jgi:hypothetical protein
MTDPWLEQFQVRRAEREKVDRAFTLLGETLTVKPSVAPEVGLRLGRFQIAMAAFVEDYQKAEAAKAPLPASSGYTDEEMLALSESVIVDCLTADSLPAWERLRRPDAAEPLTLIEIYGLATYVAARAAGLPTGGPSASSDGQPNGNTSSKARSPSRAGTRKR